MHAPHASQAPARPAIPARPAALSRIAAFGLPAVPIATDGPAVVEAPTLGVVASAVRVAPEVAVLALAVTLPSLLVGARLLGARRWSATPGRTGYGLGLCAVGLAGLAVAVGGWLDVPAYLLAIGVNLAAVCAEVAFVAALLVMSGPAVPLRVRLRRVLDGAIVGLCLMFCGRVLLVSSRPHLDSLAFWLIMFHCCVLATAVLAAVRPRHNRRGPVLCAAGVAVATLGLAGLAFALAHDAPLPVTSGIVASLVAVPVLIRLGTAGLPSSLPALIPRLPLVAVPVVLALAVALYRLITGGEIDRGAMMLGTLAALAVGVRHLIVALTDTTGTAATSTATTGATMTGAATTGAAETGAARATAETEGLAPTGSAAESPAALDAAGEARPPAGLDAITVRADRGPALDPSGPAALGGGEVGLSVTIGAMRSTPSPSGALVVVGIDGPDAVVASDDVRRELGQRLRSIAAPVPGMRTPEGPIHLTTTEFAVVTGANLAQAYGLAERLVAGLAEPLPVGRGTVRLSAWAGLADVGSATGPADAITRARLALQRARQLGPGRVEWYDAVVAEAVARRATLERDLPGAEQRGELDLIYQPIVDLERGRPLAVEALLRWRHPRLGTLLPADVIPVAEATGTIGDIGHWVLRRATAQLASWRRAGRDLSMAINVSPRQLGTTGLAREVIDVLAMHDLPPERLVIEVAEPEIGDDVDECVGALRSLGVQTALDEFGTGPASLAHLRRLPIDMVKVGPSALDADSSPPLIGVMVGVGRRLGIEVVAQGVEAPRQLAAVRDAGCRLGQGHLFARPQPAEHTEAYLEEFATR